jgi:hypothetical protein
MAGVCWKNYSEYQIAVSDFPLTAQGQSRAAVPMFLDGRDWRAETMARDQIEENKRPANRLGTAASYRRARGAYVAGKPVGS